MKSKTKKRLIAFMLCMVLVLSSAISAFADDLDTQAQDQTTTMADEPVATSMDDSTDEQQPVAEAEENQEQAVETQEQAVETQEEQQTEENVSEEPTTEDSSAVAEQEAIEKESDVSIQTTVNGTTITMSGPHSSFPEGTTYEISASELNEDETKDVEIALKKKEDENDIKIATYKAYDIKLLVDGVESQPTGDVNVKFEGGEVTENITDSEKVDVYHVDEHNQVANTVTETATTETVTMTTNHFSTYVITTTTDAGVEITVQHYLQNPKKQLYRDSTVHLAKGQKIEDLSSLMNYKAEKVVKINTDDSEGAELRGNEVITENQTYRVYYSATTGNSNESVQMFDYQVKGDNNVSINDANNYSSSSSDTTRFASGLANNQYSGNGYNTTINVNGSTVYINTWDQKSGSDKKVNQLNGKAFGDGNAATGIIKGVNFNTGALIMGKNSSNKQMYEPGFFTNDPKPGKQILSGYKLNFKQLISSYEQTVSEKDAAHEIDYDAELQKAEAYNEALLPSILPDSFAVAAASDKEDQSYMDALNIAGDKMMGIVEIPKIDIKLPIYHTTDENVLKQAAGHLEGSSLPIGGKSTHAVISAHRGLPSASLFTDLDQLEEGDHFLIHVLNETLCYEVDKISVVKPEETSSLAVEEGKDLVTLLTCTPYGVNTERLLVRGHRVPYVEQEVADEKTPLSGISLHTNYLLWVIIGLVITTIFILMLYLKEKKLQKKKNETS